MRADFRQKQAQVAKGRRAAWRQKRVGAANQTLAPGQPALRLLRFARNDRVSACHCGAHSDEAISVKYTPQGTICLVCTTGAGSVCHSDYNPGEKCRC